MSNDMQERNLLSFKKQKAQNILGDNTNYVIENLRNL